MRKINFSHLPTWLPKQLERVQLSAEQLAHRAGVSRTCIYRYMYDQDRPSKKTMLGICRALDIPPEQGLRQYSTKPNGRPKKLSVAKAKRNTSRQWCSLCAMFKDNDQHAAEHAKTEAILKARLR